MSEDDPEFVGKLTQKAVLFGPDGTVLLTSADGQWQPPGGTFEYGETPVGGLRRELREELDVESRVGPPVEAIYGGWVDEETYDPMVTLVSRCETDEREISLNEEHDEFAWLSPGEAIDRLEPARLQRAVRRAVAIGDDTPFEAVTDPYAGADLDRDAVLAELERLRTTELATFEESGE